MSASILSGRCHDGVRTAPSDADFVLEAFILQISPKKAPNGFQNSVQVLQVHTAECLIHFSAAVIFEY